MNVDLVRSIFAGWERGDFSSADWADPEIEMIRPEGPASGSSSGPAGMADGWRDFLSAWKDFRVEAEEFIELDEARVLVFVRFSGTGRASGIELGRMGTRGAQVFHFRGGRVTRTVVYADRERARTELGLAPEANP